MGYNIDNLEPIANWGADPAVLIVGPDSPFNSVADLLKFAKANPGKVTFSDAYRSQKDIKILAIADLQREETFLPDVPTLKEEGVNVDNSSVNFRGIMAPKGTDPKIIEFLATKVPLMFNDKKTLKQMKKGGSPMRIMNRAEVQAMWKERKKSLTKLLA